MCSDRHYTTSHFIFARWSIIFKFGNHLCTCCIHRFEFRPCFYAFFAQRCYFLNTNIMLLRCLMRYGRNCAFFFSHISSFVLLVTPVESSYFNEAFLSFLALVHPCTSEGSSTHGHKKLDYNRPTPSLIQFVVLPMGNNTLLVSPIINRNSCAILSLYREPS